MSSFLPRLGLIGLVLIACSPRQRHSADPVFHNGGAESQVQAAAGGALSAAGASAMAARDPVVAPAAGAGGTVNSTGISAGLTTEERSTAVSNHADAPSLRDAAGKLLPQTEALPTFDSPSFRQRIELLVRAIVEDAPQLAAPAFFPLEAYEQVKAIAQPARDYRYRLMAAFGRNIHEYHRELGKDPAAAKLIGIAPSTLKALWMKPGTEGNSLGYYRLLRSRLKVADARGAEHAFEITSMISWRGEWYVVHLHGFK